jgi:hypothetical protein
MMLGLFDLFYVCFDSILQAITPNQLLGRVWTCVVVVGYASLPLSTVVGGLVIDQAIVVQEPLGRVVAADIHS